MTDQPTTTSPEDTVAGIDVYWIGGHRWIWVPHNLWRIAHPERARLNPSVRAFLESTWRARKPWQRRWQAEWPGCERAVRGWTRRGAYLRALREVSA